jgi:hypothetical protein
MWQGWTSWVSRRHVNLQPLQSHASDFMPLSQESWKAGIDGYLTHLDQRRDVGPPIVAHYQVIDDHADGREQNDVEIGKLDAALKLSLQRCLYPMANDSANSRLEGVARRGKG